MFKLDLEKAEEPEIKLPMTCWITEKSREFQKNIYFSFIVYAKAFDCVDHNKLKNSSRNRNTRPPDLPSEKNLYSGQESTFRTGYGTTNWFQIEKGVHQHCILSCLFNLYSEYIMQNAGLDEAQARVKIAGRNINNLRYPDNTTITAEIEEALKCLLIKVKGENEKVGLKLNIQKTKIQWHLVPSFHGIYMGKQWEQ